MAENFDIKKYKKVHFIGIGGIGVSAIARMMLHEGKEVSGSDRDESEITQMLEKAGVKLFYGQKAGNIPAGTDLVIYTVAITPDNPEFIQAKEMQVEMMTYPEFVGAISKNKFTIAVSGTHGKTTTTGMIAKVLMDAGLDPTVIVGSLIKDKDGNRTNYIAGNSKYLVIEACEYRRSFLNYYPQILVVTNIDNDHLDYFKDLADIQSAFNELAKRIPQDGFVVTDKNNPAVAPALREVSAKVENYTLYSSLPMNLKVPGIHNKKNAAAAFIVGTLLGIEPKIIQASLETFPGTWRRFEFMGETEKGVKVYDDYGHHPTEIIATLQGARELYPRERLIAVFQPHLYSRTKLLLDDFAKAFDNADEVVLAPIYAAREESDGSISSELLAKKISERDVYTKNFSEIKDLENYLLGNSKKGDVVIVFGAGDIYKVAENIVVE